MPGGNSLVGRISWFGGPHDPSAGPTTASGAPVNVPGIAVYNHATLGGYWLVRAPNGQQRVVRQTDIGPAPWTGRSIDFSYSLLGQFGYNEGNFPTNATAKATYLGKSVPAQYQHLAPSTGGQAQPAQQQSVTLPVTTQSFDQAGFKQATNKFLAGSAVKEAGSGANPFNATTPGASKGLSQALSSGAGNPLFAKGLLTTTAPNPGDFVSTQTKLQQFATGALQHVAGTGLANVHGGAKGYVSPIPGAVVGRTDQGVDANLRPGAPIRALGDSKVVQIVSWYKGQPLVLMQLTSGPKAGQYWYVAEQIAPNVRAGQTVRAGQVIGTYASHGTGLELGWGSPNTPHFTLATAPGHGGYSEGQVTPEGSNFRSFLGSLGTR